MGFANSGWRWLMTKFNVLCSMVLLVSAAGCTGNVSGPSEEASPVALAEQALSGVECFLDASTCLGGILDPLSILGVCSADFDVCIDGALSTADGVVSGTAATLDACGASAKSCVGSGLDVGVCKSDFEGCTHDLLDVPATAFGEITGLTLPTDTVKFALGCSLDSIDCASASGWSLAGLDVCRADLTNCATTVADKGINESIIIVGGAVDLIDDTVSTASGIAGAVTGFAPSVPTLGGAISAADTCRSEFQICAFGLPDLAVCLVSLDACMAALDKVTPL
jgi:hypothetical protein